MTFSKKQRLLFYLFIFICIVVLDQMTKWALLSCVSLNHTKDFIPGIVQFNLVKNTGGAFSILKDYPGYFQVIGFVNFLIFLYLTFCPTVNLNNFIKIGCAFVLGGTTGNLFDRFVYGGVIDFLDLKFVNFAIFNLADVSIDIGVGLIIIGWYLQNKNLKCHPER